jgi:hypothetical protein
VRFEKPRVAQRSASMTSKPRSATSAITFGLVAASSPATNITGLTP